MEIIEPKIELLNITPNAAKLIEAAGRTCYKSEDKITDDSAEKFCEMIQTRNHMSVLEHASATFRIICDRGVGYEIVRHRICSFSQESTRYCNYSPDKKGMQFIQPSWISDDELQRTLISIGNSHYAEMAVFDVYHWVQSLNQAEDNYNQLIQDGWTPQQARSVLPNCLKTEIVMTANFREWLHFLELRTSPQAHPDMQVIAKMIGNKLHELVPCIFKNEY